MKLEVMGKKFGKLTVISEVDRYRLPSGQTNRVMNCLCDCGNTKVIRLSHLTRNRITTCKSCTHQKPTDPNKNRIHRIWRGMKDRCKPNHSEPHLYFDKGIRVYDEWLTYKNFESWALNNGYSHELCIDRKNGNDIYKPENCRWVTPTENANNRINTLFVEYNGITIPIMDLIRSKGLLANEGVIRGRLKRGWSINESIETPIRIGNYRRKIKDL